ncbi:AsmA family protein, partial [Elstera sp.]|uniref:AsmA family protein n=1 Tax=Elstera sp. TaxID=1916664 RepID=UPI0037C17BBF
MSKRGIGWIILLGLCLALVGAVLLVPRWIDWTQYRDELTDLIGDVTGRRVAIDGDVRLTLLPTPSFRAEEVRLGEAAGERSPIFLRADAIQADLD